MPDVATVLKQEITRLARKEVRAVAQHQSKQIQSLKATIRNLRDQVASLEKSLSAALKNGSQRNARPPASEEGRPIRISAKAIRSQRKRLKLSQAKMANLLGVSTATVFLWESGRTSPRGKNREAVAEMRAMGIRDVKMLLEST